MIGGNHVIYFFKTKIMEDEQNNFFSKKKLSFFQRLKQ